MSVIWMNGESFQLSEFESESDLESSILKVSNALFGEKRFYLDVKKKIGTSKDQRIPDGYLIDLKDSRPKLYFVENELERHDPLRHVAVQILNFALAFEADKRVVRKIVFDAIQADIGVRQKFEAYLQTNSFRNLDHLIDEIVFESPFTALVIIDKMPDKLEKVLAEKFRFGVEILTLTRYQNRRGDRVYGFEPFLADLAPIESIEQSYTPIGDAIEVSTGDIDTVVVPAHDEGFESQFIANNNWFAIRLHGSIRPQIKYIAAYRIRPISAITHIAPIKDIQPYGDAGKYIVYFSEPATLLPAPLKMDSKNGKIKTFQGLRYTSSARLQAASNLDEVFFGKE